TWSNILFLADAFFGSGMRSTPVGGTPNSDHLPAYLQVNVGVAREIQASWRGKLGVRLSIVNLFDRSYEIRDGTGVGVGAPQLAYLRDVLAHKRGTVCEALSAFGAIAERVTGCDLPRCLVQRLNERVASDDSIERGTIAQQCRRWVLRELPYVQA